MNPLQKYERLCARIPKLCEDLDREPSRQRRQHWEVTRRLVFEPAHSEVRALLRRMRRAAGWRPHRQMELAAARCDAMGPGRSPPRISSGYLHLRGGPEDSGTRGGEGLHKGGDGVQGGSRR